MKMYFVCEGGGEWWTCYGVLDNGFCFGKHICSHPGFAPGDLYEERQSRKAALREIFGIDDSIEKETIVVHSVKDRPVWWQSHEALQKGLAPQYERYHAMIEADADSHGM